MTARVTRGRAELGVGYEFVEETTTTGLNGIWQEERWLAPALGCIARLEHERFGTSLPDRDVMIWHP